MSPIEYFLSLKTMYLPISDTQDDDKREVLKPHWPSAPHPTQPQTLTLARDYAAAVRKPFPAIHEKVLEDKDWPKDCYVFEGKEKEPTIIYMPLFNRQNCKGLPPTRVDETYTNHQLSADTP